MDKTSKAQAAKAKHRLMRLHQAHEKTFAQEKQQSATTRKKSTELKRVSIK